MSPDAPRPLDARGAVDVSVGEAALSVRGDGDTLTIEAPDWRALREAVRSGPPRDQRRTLLDRLVQFIERADMNVEVRCGGRCVASAQRGVRAGPLSRMLGAGPLRVHISALLRSAFGARRSRG